MVCCGNCLYQRFDCTEEPCDSCSGRSGWTSRRILTLWETADKNRIKVLEALVSALESELEIANQAKPLRRAWDRMHDLEKKVARQLDIINALRDDLMIQGGRLTKSQELNFDKDTQIKNLKEGGECTGCDRVHIGKAQISALTKEVVKLEAKVEAQKRHIQGDTPLGRLLQDKLAAVRKIVG